MKDEEFYVGAVVSENGRGSRWRALIVPINVKGFTKAGHVVIRDDEGVRPTEKQLIGLCIDPEVFELKNDVVVVSNPPEFEVSDYALIHDRDYIENVGCQKNPKSIFGGWK